MDKTIPLPAARILDTIGNIEAPKGYNTIYGNRQSELPKPITFMTLAEIIANQVGWSKRFGSSATGRYQFMRNTLLELRDELKLNDKQLFDADLQDRLGYHLLKRRGYANWAAGTLSHENFMLNLSKEWASFPVPFRVKGGSRTVSRGESYYAGDKLNHSLVKAEQIEAMLQNAYALRGMTPSIAVAQPAPAPAPAPVTTPQQTVKLSFWGRLLAAVQTFNRSA